MGGSRRWMCGLWMVLFVAGCGDSDGGGAPADMGSTRPMTVSLCDQQEVTSEVFQAFMSYNLVVVGGLNREGSSQSQAVADLVWTLVATGIDFGNLDTARVGFEGGRYTLSTGDNASLTFELYTTEALDGIEAGGLITESIYDVNSWVRNIQVDLDTSVVPPQPRVSSEAGPLTPLIEGDINIDATSLNVSLRLRASAIEIRVISENTFGVDQVDTGVLQFKMTTNRVPLTAFVGDLEAAGVGFSYDGTVYEAPGEGISKQALYDTNIVTRRLENGNYAWEGTYKSRVDRGGITLYQSGLATTQGSQYTDYFCEMALQRRIGRAKHDDSLVFGIFDFAGDQQDFPYIFL